MVDSQLGLGTLSFGYIQNYLKSLPKKQPSALTGGAVYEESSTQKYIYCRMWHPLWPMGMVALLSQPGHKAEGSHHLRSPISGSMRWQASYMMLC